MKKDRDLRILAAYNRGDKMSAMVDVFELSRTQIWAITKRLGALPRKATKLTECKHCGLMFKQQRKKDRPFCCGEHYYAWMQSEAGSYHMNKRRLQGLTVRSWQRRAVALIGVKLTKGWIVPHMDGDITNCTIDNLFVFYSHSLHMAYHHRHRDDKRCLPKIGIDGFYAKSIAV